MSDCLRQIEENLELLRQQLGGKQKAKIMAPLEEQVRIDQQIRELRKEIRQYEKEYWQILADELTTVTILEASPEVVVAEIVEQAGQLQTSQDYSDEVIEWLQKIHAEVSKPGTPAAAKLKGALSMMPPFVNLSYEAELDMENFLRTNFPTFTKWSKARAKKS
jgi:chromosome segregation ATPase